MSTQQARKYPRMYWKIRHHAIWTRIAINDLLSRNSIEVQLCKYNIREDDEDTIWFPISISEADTLTPYRDELMAVLCRNVDISIDANGKAFLIAR